VLFRANTGEKAPDPFSEVFVMPIIPSKVVARLLRGIAAWGAVCACAGPLFAQAPVAAARVSSHRTSLAAGLVSRRGSVGRLQLR